MKQSIARISKVTPKAGSGISAVIIPKNRGKLGQNLIDDIAELNDFYRGNMKGYAVVSWNDTGQSFATYMYIPDPTHCKTKTDIPTIAFEKLTRLIDNQGG